MRTFLMLSLAAVQAVPAQATGTGSSLLSEGSLAVSAPARQSVLTSGPLRVHPTNARYFTDGSGRAIYLTGSHTWTNLKDMSPQDPPQPFDYPSFLDFLVRQNHNFMRMWTWDLTQYSYTATLAFTDPFPWNRTGPGNALDGKPKFDLDQFNPAYFDRLRQRVIDAGERGIYVSVMLFEGHGIQHSEAPWRWDGHPFNRSNNINGINGDPDGDGLGTEIQTLQIPSVAERQRAYIRKVVDTLNDLDNVLYEISNESHSGSQDWQYAMIEYVKEYEAAKPKQHPVGMTVEYPNGSNAELFASPADWISPNSDGGYRSNPPAADGSKVILSDTDHLWGIGGDRVWVWKSFTRGLNPIYMDPYPEGYTEGGNQPPPDQSLRDNLGYTLTYAERMDLADMVPRGDLASTAYCLANPAAQGAEYLVYLPSGGSVNVNLSSTAGTLDVEWFNPANGQTMIGGTVDGGASRSFTAPFSGDAVLYLSSQWQQNRLAVIGDFGTGDSRERDVANQLKTWEPDAVITTGDDNYPDGEAATIDKNVGQFYREFIYPYLGSYGPGAAENHFFPTLGNHDWHAPGAQPYLDYFTLPGNERYYEIVQGPVHLFAIDSDYSEPDGVDADSAQALWLKDALASSASPWKLVYFHHAPYSSGPHGPSEWMQWPFKEWGATAVLAGHDHDYERLTIDGLPYFVNGSGGASLYSFGTPYPGSEVRFNQDWGAMLIDADSSRIHFRFITRAGLQIDSYIVESGDPIFADVPWTHPYRSYIETLYRAGYTAGCNAHPLMYCPETTMNRAESSVFVERGIHAASYTPPDPSQQVFDDMPLESWAARWVNALWDDHYTAGCGTNPLIYCPWQGHTRAEGCVFYMRMLNGAGFDPPQPSEQIFADVSLEAWYARWVHVAYDAGLLEPCQTTPVLRFCPVDPLTRAQAAYMMVQAKQLTGP